MAMGIHLISMFLLCVLTSVSSAEVERNDTALLSREHYGSDYSSVRENKVVSMTDYVATDVTSEPDRFRFGSGALDSPRPAVRCFLQKMHL